jgi:DNA-binding NarL/FixJ family response regulator
VIPPVNNRSGALGNAAAVTHDRTVARLSIMHGKAYLSPEVSRAVVEAYQSNVEFPVDPLAPRQRQILQLVGEGKSTKEAAATLQISVKTAEAH